MKKPKRGDLVVMEGESRIPAHPRAGQEGVVVAVNMADPEMVMVMYDDDRDDMETAIIHVNINNLRLAGSDQK